MAFPPTRRVPQIDDFFGTKVADPFRWLEGPSTDPEISAWVRSQAAFARDFLDKLPGRSVIRNQVTALASLPTETAPRRRGGQWFRFTNDGTAEQLAYRVADTPTGTGTVLIDPNPLTENSSTSISSAVPSPDGKYVAYTYSEAGSDWQTWRVREVASGQDHPETVAWAKFTEAAWLPDSTGFFYGGFARPDAPPDDASSSDASSSDASSSDALIDANRRHQLRLHRLGTPDTEDVLVFDLPDEPQVLFSPEISDDERWLIILAERGTDPTNRVWIADLTETETGRRLQPRPLIHTDDAAWRPVAAAEGSVVLFTDADAPRGRLVRLGLESGDITELVEQRASILSEAFSAGGRLVVHWLSDAHSELTVHDLDGRQIAEITLPGLGSVLEVQGRHDSPLLHLTYTSFAVAALILQHDLDSGRTTAVFATPHAGLADVVTEQVRFTSSDGTSIPMFLVHRDNLEISNGPHPTLLYGYGGFRVPVLPAFNVSRAAFVAAGGVLAVPSLRGGGEYGADWHDAGRLGNKQNVFDDAIAAAEYLIQEGWTTSSQLACNGGSNGGLLVGALLTQRPDLFAAAVPEVGVLDLLRFQHFTIGWAWTSDYGDPDRSEAEFASAYAYSPYHRLSEGAGYPPTLVMTSDHDDRVVPAHSYKFAARLQDVSPEGAVALLRVELDGGHGAGRARSAIIDERTDALSFISNAVGLVG